ncbi:MAG TPA: hypothetical protein VHN14_26080 [Kofleriaceae bacterium]|nr:hypothetical protein [Kofleriaceae bacterium]
MTPVPNEAAGSDAPSDPRSGPCSGPRSGQFWRCTAACLFGVVVTLAATACHDEDAAGTESAAAPIVPAKDAITRTTEVGPVKATVKVWPAKPTLIEPIYLRVEVEAPPGVTVDAQFQQTGERLGRFHVAAEVRDTTRRPDGGQHYEQTYTLDAMASGRQRIPPLRFEMVDARPGTPADARKPQEILTDEIPFEIAAAAGETTSAQLSPAMGELDPDVGGIGWLAMLGIVSGIAVVGSGSVLALRTLRARRRIAQQRSAYDEAVAQLRALEDQGPPDAAAADGWFVTLSAIVRRYLEQRHEIRAPELTTEEFLQVATARPELTALHRTLLTSFLERCDRVKFAGYRPESDESLATLKAARDFVEDTRLREPIAVAVAMRPSPSGEKAAESGKAA